MPLVYQQNINAVTKIAVWHITEAEDFFLTQVPLQREIRHWHKRLQHLAGRFLLQFLFPDFPYQLIEIADTRKPFLPGEQFHFSISHCGDYAAAIVSKNKRVGIDIEIPVEKIGQIMYKYLSAKEHGLFNLVPGAESSAEIMSYDEPTLLWSAKEAVFKWYGSGGVDFRREIQLLKQHEGTETIDCFFSKNESELIIHYRQFEGLVLAWVFN